MLISIFMSKIFFMKYLPPVRPILAPKLKMVKIYWNLAHLIFRLSRSRFWCQRIFLVNIYHLLGPNWSQNYQCSEFIEIWHVRYFKYTSLDFDVKNVFLSNIYQLLGPNMSQNEKCSEFIEIWPNWYFRYADLNFHVKNDFY